MSVDFTIRNFCYPLPILKLRSFLNKSQWFPEDRLRQYQLERLQLIISHAYKNVPYYRKLFEDIQLLPGDIKRLEDLKGIPRLTKEIIRKNGPALLAKNAGTYHPIACRTSGTSGEPVEFYLDRPSNILEFCYYWRHWSWAGYRLGRCFAELSSHHFLTRPGMRTRLYALQRYAGRLQLNSLLLSADTALQFHGIIKKYRPAFLKGLASSLYAFALCLKECAAPELTFKAVFSTGEMLLPSHRDVIEKAFRCKVYDSYGHMERTVAVCECPCGGYHINSEYGIMEFDHENSKGACSSLARVIGTSLHSFAMPLIRYEVDDLIEVDEPGKSCPCGRGLPLVKKIHGRQEDIVVTPDGRHITSLFTVFEYVGNIEFAQIVQQSRDKLLLRIVKAEGYDGETEKKLLAALQGFVGPDMCVDIDYTTRKALKGNGAEKFKVVVSHVEKG